jgi:ATPase subunit of ABC transporter with duplicated ATPase domains
MEDVTFRVDRGDKIGLVGRNGAGKTTLTKILAGEGQPTGGTIDRTGEIGYLPQDPRTGNPNDLARTRILDARGLGHIVIGMGEAQQAMGSADPAVSRAAMKSYGELEDRFLALGGYAAEAEAASIASNLSLPDRILDQQLSTLSGGQRRRIELARILFSGADTMLLDEPTNHLDADSVVWLREFLKSFQGGLIVISHNIELVEETVNRVFYLDANRQVIDIYNMGWRNYQRQRAADEERRKKERANVEKKASVLQLQAAKFGAKATKAAAAHQMVRRAEKMLSGLDEVRVADRVAKLRFPEPAPCGRTPLMASNLSKSYGSLEIFAAVDLAIDRGSKVVVLGFNGAGKTTLLRLLAGIDEPDTGRVEPGHGLRIG